VQDTDFWGRLAASSIYLIGWMFWVSIVRYAIYKYGKMYRAWKGRQHDAGPDRNRQDPDRALLLSTAATDKARLLSTADTNDSHTAQDSKDSNNSAANGGSPQSQQDQSIADEGGDSMESKEGVAYSLMKAAKNGVRFRPSARLSHSESAIMDQLGLTG
jgi:hypothetical protein